MRHASLRARALAGTLALAMLRVASAVSVEGAQPGQHHHGDMDPDEFLWSKLPGRCCFELHEDCPEDSITHGDECTRTPPDSCGQCSVWSTPENYCHGSADNCATCGMSLYCASPPPLLDGNKVCTGDSRVGTGCFDEMATGMCAGKTEADCEEACHANERCELFVYYPAEMQGTCVLCTDLFSSDRTMNQATRAYALGAMRTPPAPPGRVDTSRFAVVPEPSPPSPPHPPAAASAAVKSSLGRHKSDKAKVHVDCNFVDGVEFTTSRADGYTDLAAATREECCAFCGHHDAGCANFIYEPSTGVCVLLPLTPLAQLESDDNEFVISGTASVGAVATGAATYPVSNCAFMPDSGYASGSLGPAPKLPGGEMLSREQCCQSCGVTPGCTRFTFTLDDHECTMFAAIAELVMMPDGSISSGSIPAKLGDAAVATAQMHGLWSGGDLAPPAPDLPVFAQLIMISPPPPPPFSKGDSTFLQDFIGNVSVVMGSAMAMSFLLCLYCFFSPQLLAIAHRLTGGKMGKAPLGARAHKGRRNGRDRIRHTRLRSRDDDDDDDDISDDEDEDAWLGRIEKAQTAIMPVTKGRKKRALSGDRGGGKTDSRKGRDGGVRGAGRGNSSRNAKLVVQTPSNSQTKELDARIVKQCADLEALRALFGDEFPSALRKVRTASAQLFCLSTHPANDTEEQPLRWMLITSRSEFARVVECSAFMLQDKRCKGGMPSASLVPAFEKGTGRRDTTRSERRPKGRSSSPPRLRRDKKGPLLLGMNPDVPEGNAVRPGRNERHRHRDRGRTSARSSSVGVSGRRGRAVSASPADDQEDEDSPTGPGVEECSRSSSDGSSTELLPSKHRGSQKPGRRPSSRSSAAATRPSHRSAHRSQRTGERGRRQNEVMAAEESAPSRSPSSSDGGSSDKELLASARSAKRAAGRTLSRRQHERGLHERGRREQTEEKDEEAAELALAPERGRRSDDDGTDEESGPSSSDDRSNRRELPTSKHRMKQASRAKSAVAASPPTKLTSAALDARERRSPSRTTAPSRAKSAVGNWEEEEDGKMARRRAMADLE